MEEIIDLNPLCECGCGNRVKRSWNRFIFNHHKRVRKTPTSSPHGIVKKYTNLDDWDVLVRVGKHQFIATDKGMEKLI